MPYQLSDNVKKGCLYLLKHDLEFFSQIVALVKPEYFEFPSYQRIFTGIREYYEKYNKLPSDAALVDFIKLTAPPNTKDDNDYEDDIISINQLDKGVFEHKEFIMDAVEDFARKSEMVLAVRECAQLVTEGKIDGIEERIKRALLVTRNIEVGQDYFEDVKDRVHRMFNKKIQIRHKTIFPTMNKHLEGGLCVKELGLVVAPPGGGKSLFLVNQAAKSVLEGKNVLYISCEMSEDKIGNRFDSVLTLLKNDKLKEPGTQAKLHERLDIVKSKTQGRLIIKEFPTGAANVNTIRALLVQLNLHKSFKPDLLVVDYLELLRPNRLIDSEYMAQQRIAEELRGLAVEQKCLAWTASQVNRQARKVKIITDAELGDSYGKIRPVDFAISLNQTQEEYDKGQMRVYVMKARDAKQNYVVNASVDYSTLRIEEPGMEDEE